MNVRLNDVLDVRGDQLEVQRLLVVGNLDDGLALRSRILRRRGGWRRRGFLVTRQVNAVVVAGTGVLLSGACDKRQRHRIRLNRRSC